MLQHQVGITAGANQHVSITEVTCTYFV
jgi:hypothetical protein